MKMSNSITPRTRGGSDTRSFYSSQNKRRGSAGQWIHHLGHVSAEIQSYAAGEDLLEHVSVPLTGNDSEIDKDKSNFGLPLHSSQASELSVYISNPLLVVWYLYSINLL